MATRHFAIDTDIGTSLLYTVMYTVWGDGWGRTRRSRPAAKRAARILGAVTVKRGRERAER